MKKKFSYTLSDHTVTITLEPTKRIKHRQHWAYTVDLDNVTMHEGSDLSTYHTRTDEEACQDLIGFITDDTYGTEQWRQELSIYQYQGE